RPELAEQRERQRAPDGREEKRLTHDLLCGVWRGLLRGIDEHCHDRSASAATVASVSPQRVRNPFQPLSQNRISTIATVSMFTAMVTGISRVTASACLARMRRISRSLRSAVRPSSISKPPNQYRNALIRPLCGSLSCEELPGHPMSQDLFGHQWQVPA